MSYDGARPRRRAQAGRPRGPRAVTMILILLYYTVCDDTTTAFAFFIGRAPFIRVPARKLMILFDWRRES